MTSHEVRMSHRLQNGFVGKQLSNHGGCCRAGLWDTVNKYWAFTGLTEVSCEWSFTLSSDDAPSSVTVSVVWWFCAGRRSCRLGAARVREVSSVLSLVCGRFEWQMLDLSWETDAEEILRVACRTSCAPVTSLLYCPAGWTGHTLREDK